MEATSQLPGLGRIRRPLSDLPRASRITSSSVSRRRNRAHPFFDPVLDQGGSSHCVEYSLRHAMMGSPIRQKVREPFGQVYRMAQDRDPWPGREPTYYGTSVQAGCEALVELGYIESFIMGNTMDALLYHLLEVSGVIMGTDWHRGMFSPSDTGWIEPVGPVEGGHAWYAWHVNRDTKTPFGSKGMLTGLNSWGGRTKEHLGWGVNGRFRLSLDAVEMLLRNGGDFALIIEKRR